MRPRDALMRELALATVRQRWVSFLGAFFALALGTTIVTASVLTLTATMGTPHPGTQRYAAARTIIVPSAGEGELLPAPARVSSATIAHARRAGRVVKDRSFAVRWRDESVEAVGHGWSSASLAPYHLVSGHEPRADNQIVVSADGVRSGRVGHRVTLLTPQGAARYTVVGTAGHRWHEDAVFFTDAEAARLSPAVNAVAVDASAAVVRAHVSSDAVRVLRGDQRRLADLLAGGGLGKAGSVAQMMTALSVMVVVFVLVATFAFVVDQRSRELALLRLVGASPAGVRRMIRAETVVVGAAASLVGCLLGIPCSWLLRSWMVGNGLAPTWFQLGFHAGALVIAFLIGVSAAVAGSAAAAWRASRAQPLDALHESVASSRVMSPLRWALGGLLLVGAR